MLQPKLKVPFFLTLVLGCASRCTSSTSSVSMRLASFSTTALSQLHKSKRQSISKNNGRIQGSAQMYRSARLSSPINSRRARTVSVGKELSKPMASSSEYCEYHPNPLLREACSIMYSVDNFLHSLPTLKVNRAFKDKTNEFGISHYVKGALAGGLCCSLTHGALTPLDVVKTRIQLEPEMFHGMTDAFTKIVQTEGLGTLTTGLGATAVGYFVQGWFKFGGVEFFKVNIAKKIGEKKAWQFRIPIYLVAAAFAEFIADIFLCPLEATRIRLVSNPAYADGLITAMPKILAENGLVNGFYSGFGPILMKQIPYTMTKFAVQGWAAEKIFKAATRLEPSSNNKPSQRTQLTVSLMAGVIAGVAAAVISQPADNLLSLINKEGAGGEGSIISRLVRLIIEVGPLNLLLNGLGARCFMVGVLTASQFGLFDVFMQLTNAKKFSFKDPNDTESSNHSLESQPSGPKLVAP